MNLTPAGNWYIVHVVALPASVLAAVASSEDDIYHVFINDCLSPALRQQALEHELRHIDEGHLFNDTLTIEQMEQEADGLAVPNPPVRTIPLFHSLDALKRHIFRSPKIEEAYRRKYMREGGPDAKS